MPQVPKVELGKSGLEVSKLGFGTFDFGVPSLQISPKRGGEILAEAHRLGVSFWDTSDDYGSHPHVAAALERVPRAEVVVCTKTSATTGARADQSLRKSLRELRTDYVDLFLLHYVRSDWIEGCHGVLKALAGAKERGTARAIGLSTHSALVAGKVSEFDELDAILAVCCNADPSMRGRLPHQRIPLEDGTMEEMFDALKRAHSRGKGTIAMKVLGCGIPSLVQDYRGSIEAVARLGFVDSLVIGMKDLGELRKNVEAITAARVRSSSTGRGSAKRAGQ